MTRVRFKVVGRIDAYVPSRLRVGR